MKLFQNNFGFITGNYMNNIDEAYNFLESIFMNNKFYIKSIVQSNLKLSIFVGHLQNPKEIELELIENSKQNYLFLIKDLYSKYSNIQNEINELKNQNGFLIKENSELKNKINTLVFQNNQIGINMNNQNNMIMQNMMNNMNLNNNLPNLNNINNFNINNMNNFSQDYSSFIFIEEDEVYHMPFQSISVIFRPQNGPPILIHISIYDKVSEIIKRFEVQSGINKENDKFKYFYNAKPLDEDMTVEEAGIYDEANILCYKQKEGGKNKEERKKKEIKKNLKNNENKNAKIKKLIDKWVLIDKKIYNNHNQVYNNNYIIFFELAVKKMRHILKISTPIYAKIKDVIEKVEQYLNSINFEVQFFIFKNAVINLEEKTLLEYGIRNGDCITNQ